MTVRQARGDDIPAICAIDHIAQTEEQRRQFIRSSVTDDTAFVAIAGERIAGYCVLTYSFFERGFIAMLIVERAHRRRGIGSALVRHCESLCASDRIFTSTNESNLPMQALLEKLGYTRSGVVNDLDPGDPELFYSKQLEQ
jgi:ribosomal protein S18 acetylase RimI-like enzyme